jgi:hypothetical protein
VGGGRGGGHPRPPCGRQGEATGRCCSAWWSPLGPRAQADHAQPALTAVRTARAGRERGRRAGERPALPVWGRAGGGRAVARQAALAVGQERTLDGTPAPIRADWVAPLRPPMRPQAAATRRGQERQGVPPRGPGVGIAPADPARGAGAPTGVGPGAARDLPAPVVEHACRAVPRRCARDDPRGGPDRRGQVPSGARLGHPGPAPPAAQGREGPDGAAGRLARRPPRVVVSRAPSRRHETGPGWRVGEGPGPGGQPPQAPDPAADRGRVRGTRAARLRRRAAQEVVPVVLGWADPRPPGVGQGHDDRPGGPGPAGRPPRCQPHRGVMTGARGATPVAPGGVDIGRLTTGLTRPPGAAHGRGPAVEARRQRAAMAGPASRAPPRLIGGTIAPEDVRPRWQARAPTRCASGQAGVAGGVHDVDGVGRQRRVARGGTGTLVPAAGGDAAPRPAPLPPRGGLGVAARGERGVVGEATRAYHARAGLRAGGRRARRRLVSSGEPPGPGARAASRPATAPGAVRPRAPSGLCPLGPGGRGPASAGGRWPRPGAASLPAGAAPQPSCAADPCGRSRLAPRPAGRAPPADAARRAVCGGAGAGCARRPATGAAAGARRSTASPRAGGGMGARRPAAQGARSGRTAGAPRR